MCLGRRDPWLWVIFWIVEGKRKWTRPLLLGYWALLGGISVAGWNRQMSRSRRYKPRNAGSSLGDNGTPLAPTIQIQKSSETATPTTLPTAGLGLSFANLPNLPNGTQVAADILDAADKHVPTLSINARRKFFHALAVVMFLPGVAVDVSGVYLPVMRVANEWRCETASIYTPIIQRCIFAVHLCGICAILCHLPIRCCCTLVYERVLGSQGQWNCHFEPFLSPHRLCGLGMA